jgi:predicted protein tyrosine phosphatase
VRRVLFICGKARARSPTAAQVFAEWEGVATDFGGVSRDADDALSAHQVEWADEIMVMETRHRNRLVDQFPKLMSGRAVVTLGIRDRYTFMQPELVEELIDRAGPYLKQGRRR